MLKPYFKTDLGVLYHGDCLEIMPHLEPVDLVLTDPPYGMNWPADSTRFVGGSDASKRRRGKGSVKEKIIGDDKPFDPKPFLNYPNVILWGYTHFASSVPKGTNLVWIKRFDNAFGTFLSDAEIGWMKGGHGVYCFRDLSMTAEANNRKHPNQKPIPLIQWCMERAKTDGLILDPFLGSGTTAIACERLNRHWIGIEIEEKYCEIAKRRIQAEVDRPSFFKKTRSKPKRKIRKFKI